MVLLLVHLTIVNPDLASTKVAFEFRDSDASAQLEMGERDLTLDSVYGSGNRFDSAEVSGDISSDPDYWLNIELARYYGANSVVMKER